MKSPISADSHSEYKEYSPQEAIKLYEFLGGILDKAYEGRKVPYRLESFISHAKTNILKLKSLINEGVSSLEDIKVPASLVFWVYRCCTSMHIKCPVELPHVCKLDTDLGEKFYITTKDEWIAHRAATIHSNKQLRVSDHAKLQYLSRVKEIDLDKLLSDFPYELLNSKGTTLEDGRVAINNGKFTYILEGNVCISILSKGMVVI